MPNVKSVSVKTIMHDCEALSCDPVKKVRKMAGKL